MTRGRPRGGRAMAIAVSLTLTASTMLAAPTAASAVPSSQPTGAATSRGASASAAAAAVDGALPRMDEYPAADYSEAAAALPAGLVEAAGRDLGKTAAEYLATADAATDAAQVVDALEDRGVEVLGSRLDGTVLTVSVDSAADASVVASTGAVAEVGAPESRDFAALDFEAALDVYGGQGYVWANQDGTAQQCSVGFAGYQVSTGSKRLVTAGHCVEGMSAISGPVRTLNQDRPGSGGAFGAAIGSPVAGSWAFGDGFDTGLLAANAPGVVQIPRALTWGGAASAPLASAPLAVTGQSAAIEGGDVCKSGSRTGWTCGTILAVDQPVSVSGFEVNTIVTDACVRPGDSGGAVLSGQHAVGVVSGSTDSPCGDPSHFSVLFPMLSSSGASVASKYGNSWEPAVTVSAPVVTKVVSGSATAAGSISGTLANASKASRVRVYIDGAGSAFATADASSGRWSVSLGSLAAGSHRFSAVAGWGSWSRSAAATGIVTVTAAAAGSIVRAPGGTLYLVDGSRRLVRVPSAAIAGEFTTRPVLELTAAALTAYAVDPGATLGLAVSCGGASYIAGGGQLWGLPTPSAGGLPVTALESATCAALPRSARPLGARILLRSAVTGHVSLLDAGREHRLFNPAAVRAFGGAQPATVPLSAQTLATIADGRVLLAPAQLVKTAGSSTVYLVDGMSRKIRVADLSTAAEFGLSSVTTVTQSVLSGYATAPTALTVVAVCSGSTVIAGSGRVARLASGSSGLGTTALDPVTCAALPAPTSTITGAPFLRSSLTGEIFVVQKGTKRPVSYAAAKVLNGGRVPPFVWLSKGTLAGIPTGPTLIVPGAALGQT